MSIEAVVHDIAHTIQKEANVSAVFGQPLKLDDHTVIPVGMVVISVGGGGATASTSMLSRVAEKAAEAAAPLGGAGGGGVGVNVASVPIGFLSEKNGEVVFTPIEVHEAQGDGLQVGLLNRVIDRVQRVR